MSPTAKEKVAELLSCVQAPDRTGIENLYHSDCNLILAKPFGQTEQRRGAQELVALSDAYHRAFPRFELHVQTLLEEGEKVAAQWRLEAEPSKELIEPLSQMRVESTANRIGVEGIAFYRVRNDRVLETFLLQDDLGMLMQLGVDPGGLPVVDVRPSGASRPVPAGNGSTAESDQKRFIHEFMKAVVNEKDEARREAAASEFIHADLRLCGPDAGNVDPVYTGLEKFTAGHRKYRRAFPHFEFVTLDIVEEGNWVALRWAVADAWHTGPLQFGEYELHPTGNNANVHGAAVCEIRDGKIVTIWQLSDSASLLRQLLS